MSDAKLQKHKDVLSVRSLKLLNLRPFQYAAHEIEIAEWLEVRDMLQAAERLREKQEKAALKIQAWWRGVMVRKKLGKYRKKRGKGKGKHDKKGKKSKKTKK